MTASRRPRTAGRHHRLGRDSLALLLEGAGPRVLVFEPGQLLQADLDRRPVQHPVAALDALPQASRAQFGHADRRLGAPAGQVLIGHEPAWPLTTEWAVAVHCSSYAASSSTRSRPSNAEPAGMTLTGAGSGPPALPVACSLLMAASLACSQVRFRGFPLFSMTVR